MRRGFNAVELLVAIVLVAIVTACLLIAIPASRERSRRAGCQANLSQIGKALALYHQAAGHWPGVSRGGPGPIAAMLEALGQPDFATIRDPEHAPPRRLAGPLTEHRIGGLLCPSDRNALGSTFPAPISYRANTGDTTAGQGGPFEFDRTASRTQVDAADGSGFTAAFAERLVGEGTDRLSASWAYASVPGTVGPAGCGAPRDVEAKGDAGSSWIKSDWRSTLYTHAALPGQPSCIATDGRTAFLGPSSEHPEGVHVLLLDGSLRTYRRTVAPPIWKALGTVGEPAR